MNAQTSLLLVEDSPTQAARLKFLLEAKGYLVRLADRGEKALNLCKEELPELLVTDVTMPGMDGYELCRAVKDDAKLRNIPVMLLTGLSDPKDIIWGLEAGADCYLTKPYSDEELCSRIEFVLKNIDPNSETDATETVPIDVSFLGQDHTITSTRKQILSLLLSSYESAARRNKQLDKVQLKMKIDLKEAKRKREAAEAALTLAEAELDDQGDSLDSLFTAFPFPAFLFHEDGSLAKSGGSPLSEQKSIESREELDALDLSIQSKEFEYQGERHELVFVSPPSPTTDNSSPAETNPRALPNEIKRDFLGKISDRLHQGLNEARAQTDDPIVQDGLLKSSVLDLLEWEALTYHLELSDFDLLDEIQLILDSPVLFAQASHRKQKIELAESCVAPIFGDRQRIRHALREVVENAIVFGPEDSKIELSLRPKDAHWEVSIKDQGHGPSAPLNSKEIVEPFIASNNGGLGLGLSYADRVCKSHDGSLNCATSDDGFEVSLTFSQNGPKN